MAARRRRQLWIAYRTRPTFRGLSPEQQSLERYRVALDPYRRLLTVRGRHGPRARHRGVGRGRVADLLAFCNAQSFGSKDPQFGIDLSFYIFTLPFLRFLVGFGFGVVVVSLLAAVVTHYLYGGLRLQTPGERRTPAARAHLAVLLGLFVLLKAVAYWLDRYGLVGQGRRPVTGVTYTDVNAVLPAKLILSIIALICALLFFVTVVRRNWLAPALGLALLVRERRRRRRHLPALRAVGPGAPERAGQGGAVHPAQHRRHRAAYGLDAVKVAGLRRRRERQASCSGAAADTSTTSG